PLHAGAPVLAEIGPDHDSRPPPGRNLGELDVDLEAEVAVHGVQQVGEDTARELVARQLAHVVRAVRVPKSALVRALPGGPSGIRAADPPRSPARPVAGTPEAGSSSETATLVPVARAAATAAAPDCAAGAAVMGASAPINPTAASPPMSASRHTARPSISPP